VRKALDENDRMKNLYSYLSSGAHPKTQSISHILRDNFVLAGNYDKKFTEYAFLMILRTIDEFVEDLLDIIHKQHNFDLEDLHSKHSNRKLSEDEELFILAVGQYSILVERLNEFQCHIDSEAN
jgi:hypothetical protein